MAYPFVQARYDYGPRSAPVRGFVIHMAEGGGTVGYLSRDPARGVSVHYVIEYSGRVVQMLREDHVSGSINPAELRTTDDLDHFYGVTAAKAVMQSDWSDPNTAAITVEIEGFAAVGPNPAEKTSLVALVNDVRNRYPTIGLLGHRDFASYKACPGKLIPWTALGGHGPAEVEMTPAPWTSDTPMLVSTGPKSTWYDLDGKTVVSAGHSALLPRPSPYGIGTGATLKRAIFVPGRIVMVVPASVAPVPPPVVDCTDVVTRELTAAADRAAVAVKQRP